jgi:glutaredoxin 3
MAKVTVYSSPQCPACEKAKHFLEENKVEFDVIDVSEDREAAIDVVNKTGQMSIPIIKIDDEYLVGFNKDALRAALKLE